MGRLTKPTNYPDTPDHHHRFQSLITSAAPINSITRSCHTSHYTRIPILPVTARRQHNRRLQPAQPHSTKLVPPNAYIFQLSATISPEYPHVLRERRVESRQDAVRTRRKQDYPEETGIIR